MWLFLSRSWVAFGRPSYLLAVLQGVPRHWRFPPASGGHPPRLIHPSGVGFIAWRLRRPKKGNADGTVCIFGLDGRVWTFGPATEPTLKTALCHIRALVGRIDKYQRSPQTFSKPMYGTRPCCLVQAIIRHTSPDPHLGS